jgi:hypothetical protein
LRRAGAGGALPGHGVPTGMRETMTVTTANIRMAERRPKADRIAPAVSLPVVLLVSLAMWAGIIFAALSQISW